MKFLTFFVIGTVTSLLLACGQARAQGGPVVIPMFDDPVANVITVGVANADFTDPVAALASITDAAVNKPYLVVIGPGFYILESPLEMKSHVHISGSGRGVTTLGGQIGGASADEQAALVYADNVIIGAISNLNISNNGSGKTHSIGLYSASSTIGIRNVSVSASDAEWNYGIYNTTDENGPPGSIVIKDVTVSANNGLRSHAIYNWKAFFDGHDLIVAANTATVENYGLYNVESDPRLVDARIRVNGPSADNYGVYNFFAGPVLINIDVLAQSGSENYGVYTTSESLLKLLNSTATGIGDENSSYGLYSVISSPRVEHSNLAGETAGASLDANSTGARLANVRIDGGVVDGATGTQCRENYAPDLSSVSC